MAVPFYTPQFTGDTCYTSQLQIYYSGNGRMLIFETDYYTHQSRATSGSFRLIYTKKIPTGLHILEKNSTFAPKIN